MTVSPPCPAPGLPREACAAATLEKHLPTACDPVLPDPGVRREKRLHELHGVCRWIGGELHSPSRRGQPIILAAWTTEWRLRWAVPQPDTGLAVGDLVPKLTLLSFLLPDVLRVIFRLFLLVLSEQVLHVLRHQHLVDLGKGRQRLVQALLLGALDGPKLVTLQDH